MSVNNRDKDRHKFGHPLIYTGTYTIPMDKGERNYRLYSKLISEGLNVEPIIVEKDGIKEIDFLKVSC